MLRLLGVLLGVFTLASVFSPTADLAQTTAVPSACPYGSTFADGCAAANPHGSFQRKTFFADASQNGAKLTHGMAWNVAGVDYPVGYDATLALKDPATASLPAGCTYQPGGRGGISNVPTVDCANHAGFTLNGYDFSGGHSTGAAANGVFLYLDAGLTGACIITNNKFVSGPNHANNSVGLGPLPLMQAVNSTGCAREVEFNSFDGNWPTYTFDISEISDSFTAPATYKYNVCKNMEGRCLTGFGTGACASLVYDYNYQEYAVMVGGGNQHGEEWTNFAPSGCTIASIESNFNTLWIPNNTPSGVWTAPFFLASSSNYDVTLTAATLSYNTIVVAPTSSGGATSGASFLWLGYPTIGSLTVQGNHVFPRGGYFCVYNGGTVNGLAGSIRGTTITVTAAPGKVVPGAYLNGGGVTTPTKIAAYGAGGTTGTGGTGTYIGSVSQSASFTNAKATSAIDVFTFGGAGSLANINMYDGSTITYSGFDGVGGTCNGKHS